MVIGVRCNRACRKTISDVVIANFRLILSDSKTISTIIR